MNTMSKHKPSAGRIAGLAARFDSDSLDLGGYTEVVKPGAFRDSLAAGDDVRALLNHEQIIGRSTNGTLTLHESAVGLHFECSVSDTTAGRDVVANVERRDQHQCSFAFNVEDGGERWFLDADGEVRRELTKLRLADISIVNYPAYTQTEVHKV